MNTRRLALVALCALALGACSGGEDTADSTTTSTSVAPTTTSTAPTTTSVPDLTSTTVPGPTMPLTGLPVTDDAAATRPALVVKIDNHPRAVPQAGLQVADLVYEENVENLTRFAAVFHSEGSDPVGPIRSGRTQDVLLLGSLSRPLFVWSGGNPNVTRAIESSDLVDLSGANGRIYNAGGFFRSDRPGPHDLYAGTTQLWTLAPADAVAPPPQFTYRQAGVGATGEPGDTARVRMDNVEVVWVWDDARSQYLRQQNGQPHLDDTGVPLGTENVVVLTVEYLPSPADRRSPEAQTIGTGEALVLTGGVAIRGTWERTDRLAPFTLRDDSGTVIALSPGSTWVQLARAGTTTVPA